MHSHRRQQLRLSPALGAGTSASAEKYHAVYASQDHGFNLLNRLLAFDPRKRLSAKAALEHPWFQELPLPCEKALMPTYPTKKDGGSELARDKRKAKSPDPVMAYSDSRLFGSQQGP